ncbi:MAG TPA: hypothetical protein VHW45_15025 [Candidatus Sulfotelmatobacter sp.]|jgi:hypothetical protein|nr:hypothetical protein [Candidatus Sulfotelmatobacter sp.]
MHPTALVAFLEFSRTAFSMSMALVVLFVIALWVTKRDVAQAHGLDKIVALSNLCFAIPLAAFGAEHISAAQGIKNAVPAYMPWHLFWAYFVGFALIAASLSIATKVGVRWSGLLFGIMMFLFVAMIHLPGALTDHQRTSWVVVFREPSFAAGAWLLSASATNGWQARGKSALIIIGRVIIGITAIFFSVQQFLHPTLAYGVPLEKPMPGWIPAPGIIGYLTAAILLIAGICILLAQKTRLAATYLGTWILLLVIFVYGPILVTSLMDPSTAVKVEGLNYFADTLLFAGAILALAKATTSTDRYSQKP